MWYVLCCTITKHPLQSQTKQAFSIATNILNNSNNNNNNNNSSSNQHKDELAACLDNNNAIVDEIVSELKGEKLQDLSTAQRKKIEELRQKRASTATKGKIFFHVFDFFVTAIAYGGYVRVVV